MSTWPLEWRADLRAAERHCPHGIGHPDLDDQAYRRSIAAPDQTHACDGCCTPA